MGYKKPIKLFNNPKTTVKVYVKNAGKSVENLISGTIRKKVVLLAVLEKKQVNYCLQMEKNYFDSE